MPTLYKIYAVVLVGRLEKEVEGKGMISENQAGFRRGRTTTDHIYVLNHIIGKMSTRRRGKAVALFVDLRAAFDTVGRRVLWEAMEKRGVREGLRERVREIYRETKSRVRVGGEGFWTTKGLRQGCSLNPILFNMLIADVEEEFRKGRWGGVEVGGRRICTLAYADDLVLLAREEEEMESMIRRLEGYLEKKRLEINVGKTKVMRFKKGGGGERKMDWRWKGKRIEEVKEFRYLGYVFKRNGGQEAQIRDRVKKAGVAMRQVWGIGKRKFERDWGRRMWLFDTLVWSVAGYGVEIWGWKEREDMERMQERYIRWSLGVDWRTPGYMVREETKRMKLRAGAGERAWRYEEKLGRGEGGELARWCLVVVREREREGEVELSAWERERMEYRRERGIWEGGEGRRGREESEGWGEQDGRRQEEERRARIRQSRYNKWYREIVVEEVPKYLRAGWGEARYRLGNEMRGGEILGRGGREEM
ncbi:uncharacterized protein LOC122403516 [Colletes gigas]|uniref:uncharacterized protein LOC122403516 n=1 Tax=Colletes gigas TaxID=935657 RepID=UPI001C9B1BA9|nr:uncharacterized protein LOC122403516 [Colletes gigas]